MGSSRSNNRQVLGEVARPLLAWPLRSRGRLVAVVVAAIAALWFASSTLSGSAGSTPASTSTSSAAATSDALSTTDTSSSEPAPITDEPKESSTSSATSSASPVTAPPAAIDTARRFMGAWLHTNGVAADKWRAGMAPYITPNLKSGFDSADPGRVPATKITGAIKANPVAADEDAFGLIVPTDGGPMSVGMVASNGQWLVSMIEPASEGSAAAAPDDTATNAPSSTSSTSAPKK